MRTPFVWRACLLAGVSAACVIGAGSIRAQESIPAAGSLLDPIDAPITITAADVTAEKIGASIPKSEIGEPVSEVKLNEPQWVDNEQGGYGQVDGQIMPVDPEAPPINFRVMLPGKWSLRSAQLGGGGMNGTIPGLNGREFQQGMVTYGSDSGHQMGGFGGGFPGGGRGGFPGGARGGFPGGGGFRGRPGAAPGAAPAPPAGRPGVPGAQIAAPPAQAPGRAGPRGAAAPGGRPGFGGGFPGGMGGGGFGGGGGGGGAGSAWAVNEEAIKNLGYMQMKKTHDAAMYIIEKVYGQRPRFNYYFGGSQGGREALTVAQRYPADYDGIVADVPIVNFSSLMLAPELIRIQEKPLDNWVTPAKVNAIRAEFIRQADGLDGLEDGIINNYVAARALFDMSQGDPDRDPWKALRGPAGKDPNPDDTSAAAKLTNGQINTLEMVYSKYKFATPLANGVTSFGMWVPNTDPSGSGLIANTRYKGQEGAGENAQNHSHLGVLGVTGFLMEDPQANPLDYVEGGELNERREEISEWLDSTNPDLSEFYRRGGKMIVTIGTNDTLASPGAQLDYYQSILDKMGRDKVDAFARLFVLPQTGHGLSGRSASVNGAGEAIEATAIPNQFDKRGLLMAWVEKNEAPAKTLVATAGDRSLPVCSYPNYPKYVGGPAESADSYECATP